MGRGYGGIFYQSPEYATPIEITPAQRLTALKQKKEFLESELNSLQNSIEDVSKTIEEESKTIEKMDKSE